MPIPNRSFDNPLFDSPQILQTNINTKQTSEHGSQPEPNLLVPIPKNTSSTSLKSTKSNKSLRSLLGFNKEPPIETPMIDVSIDIGMEASKFDVFDSHKKEEQTSQTNSNIDPEGISL